MDAAGDRPKMRVSSYADALRGYHVAPKPKPDVEAERAREEEMGMESGWTEVSKASRCRPREPDRNAPKKTSKKTGKKKGPKASQRKEAQETQVPKTAPVQVTELLRPRKQRETTRQPVVEQHGKASFSYAEAAKGKSSSVPSALQPGQVVGSPLPTAGALVVSTTSSTDVTSIADSMTSTASTPQTATPKANTCVGLQQNIADPAWINAPLVAAKKPVGKEASHAAGCYPLTARPKPASSRATPNPQAPPFCPPTTSINTVLHTVGKHHTDGKHHNTEFRPPTAGRVYNKRRRCFSTGHISTPSAELDFLPLPIWYFVLLSRTFPQLSQQTTVPRQPSRPSCPCQPSRQPSARGLPSMMDELVDKMNNELGSLETPEPPLLMGPVVVDRAGYELWDNPVGWDVLIKHGEFSWKVHSHILCRDSMLFRARLTRAIPAGQWVTLDFNHHCRFQLSVSLYFMYTNTFFSPRQPSAPTPLCARPLVDATLLYIAGTSFMCAPQVSHGLSCIAYTTARMHAHLARTPRSELAGLNLRGNLAVPLTTALEMALDQGTGALMRPLRAALAHFLDRTLMYLVLNVSFRAFVSERWGAVFPALAADLEHMRAGLDGAARMQKERASERAKRAWRVEYVRGEKVAKRKGGRKVGRDEVVEKELTRAGARAAAAAAAAETARNSAASSPVCVATPASVLSPGPSPIIPPGLSPGRFPGPPSTTPWVPMPPHMGPIAPSPTVGPGPVTMPRPVHHLPAPPTAGRMPSPRPPIACGTVPPRGRDFMPWRKPHITPPIPPPPKAPIPQASIPVPGPKPGPLPPTLPAPISPSIPGMIPPPPPPILGSLPGSMPPLTMPPPVSGSMLPPPTPGSVSGAMTPGGGSGAAMPRSSVAGPPDGEGAA